MNSASRIPEIDLLRVAALILMILYHLFYDLDTFTQVSFKSDILVWMMVVAKLAAFLFIFLSGISSNLSRKPIHNGITLLFWALLISLITSIALPETYVRFGILHFLACMLLLYPIFQRSSTTFLIIFALVSISLGFYFKNIHGIGPWLIPLGIMYPGFKSIDYFPVFPYSGLFVFGILFYRFRFAGFTNSSTYSFPPIIEKMSRHSLLIYLLHQPILLLILFIFQKAKA
ncbi:heparan-alpha-glucosaminide N-acetyltransferase [Desulfitobacterium sp. AusDCA]|uniref:heparan-alpha-glucosaminide N-acetyltransferase n=1 Tax=Desulfitobacterium sp. AusDCA TaxID=3240383 RepID=UPI003DA70DA8